MRPTISSFIVSPPNGTHVLLRQQNNRKKGCEIHLDHLRMYRHFSVADIPVRALPKRNECVTRKDAMASGSHAWCASASSANCLAKDKNIKLDFLRCEQFIWLRFFFVSLPIRFGSLHVTFPNSIYRVAHKIEHASFLSTPNCLQILGKSGRHKAPRQVVFIIR